MSQNFEDIYIKYQRKVYFYLCQYVKNSDVAYDLTQDTFVSLWEYRNNIDKNKDILPYIITIAKHKALNHLRIEINKYKNNQSLDVREISTHISTLEGIPDEQLITKDIQLIVSKVIEGLPKKQKNVFYLSRNKNLTYEQIAKQHNVSVKTIEYRMSQVLKTLRVHLKGYLSIFI